MSRETLVQPEVAEPEMTRLLEAYRELPVTNAEVYGFFDVDGSEEVSEARQRAKQEFLDGTVHNPNIPYPKLRDPDSQKFVAESQQQLLQLMLKGLYLDHDPDRVRAFEDNLRGTLLGMAFVQVAMEITADAPDDKEQLITDFNQANDELYGELDPVAFFGLVAEERKKADALLENSEASPLAQQIAGEYKGMTPELDGMRTERFKPSRQTIDSIGELVGELYGDILELVPRQDEKLSTEQFAELFRAAHERRGTGWSVEILAGKTAVESRQRDKTTVVGAERKLVDSMGAAKLLIHENGVHAERRFRGDKMEDQLFKGLGLAGYGVFEEGLGVAMEEAMEGALRNAGTQYYLAMGFARGLDGKTRDFRDTFELAWRREALKRAKDGQLDEAMVDKARAQAYNQCVRIFRGTPCDVPGMVFTKDQSYFRGNEQAWKVLEQIAQLPQNERKPAFEKILAAKYDPTSPLHQRLIDKAIEGYGQYE